MDSRKLRTHARCCADIPDAKADVAGDGHGSAHQLKFNRSAVSVIG
jgi:hypothetical protein